MQGNSNFANHTMRFMSPSNRPSSGSAELLVIPTDHQQQLIDNFFFHFIPVCVLMCFCFCLLVVAADGCQDAQQRAQQIFSSPRHQSQAKRFLRLPPPSSLCPILLMCHFKVCSNFSLVKFSLFRRLIFMREFIFFVFSPLPTTPLPRREKEMSCCMSNYKALMLHMTT